MPFKFRSLYKVIGSDSAILLDLLETAVDETVVDAKGGWTTPHWN